MNTIATPRTGRICATFALGLSACLAASAVQVPEEEQFGQRVWFINGDRFETGNYRDYFCRTFSGELLRNQAGYTGYVCRIAIADSRPFRVVGGRKYVLKMKVHNLGDGVGLGPAGCAPSTGCAFPTAFAFLRDDWKEVKVVRARERDGRKGGIEGAFVDAPPPVGKWIDCAFPFVAPEGAEMFMFTVSYGRKTAWGRYLLADVRLEEAK